MGRFGFGKKKDEEDDSNRSALFGSRSKNKSPAPPPANNPYAIAPPDPYTQAKMKAGIVPPVSQTPPPSYPQSQGNYPDVRASQQSFGNDNKAKIAQNAYTPNRYGNEGGYGGPAAGSNPYSGVMQTSGTARSGGYGGLGPSRYNDDQPDENRDALFGAAPQRVQQQQPPVNGQYDNNYEDPSQAKSYGAYGDRQLTAEEEEEEDIRAHKEDILATKKATTASIQNAIRIAAQAEETGTNTLARLGAQGERLHNTKKNLDLAQNQISIAEDKRAELQRINRSMFIPVNSPFGRKNRLQKEEERIQREHTEERQRREGDREVAYRQQQRLNNDFKAIGEVGTRNPASSKKTNLAERGKYQFEADSEDERLEDEIDEGIDILSGAATRMNRIGKALGAEIDSQNQIIEKIGIQSDAVDDRVTMETARLKRIK